MGSGPARPSDPILDAIGEFGLIHRIDTIIGEQRVPVGIGDDAAVLEGPEAERYLLATVDMLVEDIHFRLESISPPDLGRRALAINLSDMAAMGGTPSYALSSIAVRPDLAARWVEDLYRGMREEAERYSVAIVGGNVTRTAGPIALDLTLLGSVPKDEVVLRSGAQVGDVLAITGYLGEAAAARMAWESHDLRQDEEIAAFHSAKVVPRARIESGRALASKHLAHAMLDLSDGLGSDVHHLAESSGAGAVIYQERLPISLKTREVARHLGLDPLDLALYGGEDYELLVALPERSVAAAASALGEVPLHVVGTVVHADQGVVLERVGGRRDPLAPRGWTHF